VKPLWTDIAGVVLVAGQLIVLIVGAAFAASQLREAKRLREAQGRPFVMIDFEIEKTLIFLTISNIGATMAREVRFTIDPPFATAIDSAVDQLKLLKSGISTLPPGKTFRTLFDGFIQRDPEQLPDLYSVRVAYCDDTLARDFNEQIDLDLGVYRNLGYIDEKGVGDLHDRLKDIAGTMKEWRAGGGRGLLVLTPDQNRAENERQAAAREERRARIDAAQAAATDPPEPPAD
jgi:hypothetical protein